MCSKIKIEQAESTGEETHNRYKATIGARVIATAASREVLDDKVVDWCARHVDYILGKGYANVYVYELVEAVELDIVPLEPKE